MQYDSDYPFDDAREALTTAIFAERERGRPAVVSVLAPLAPLETVLSVAPSEDAVLWHPAEGTDVHVGLGAAASLPLEGRAIGRSIDAAVAALRDVCRVAAGAATGPAPVPRLFGGAPFDPRTRPAGPWAGLGPGALVLPRFTYTRQGDRALLGVALDGTEGRQGVLGYDRLLEGAYTLLEALELHAGGRTGSIHARPVTGFFPEAVGPTENAWSALVAAAREVISEGDLERVFLGQFHEIVGDVRVTDPLELLARLAVEVKDATRFALRRSGTSLVGYATETLLRRRGRAVLVETRAGATAAEGGAGGAATTFVPSRRERRRREGVMDDLVAGFAGVGVELVEDPDTSPRRARSSVSWVSSASAFVAPSTSVGGLVGAVHPSPAYTGHPKRAAEVFLDRTEGGARGWLGGTFGWVDASGDCDLVSVDRGALLDARSVRAFAGASVVSDSDASAERAEVAGKLRALLRALGVQSTSSA